MYITLDEEHTNVWSDELSKMKSLKIDNNGECLNVSRGMRESIEESKFKDFDKSKLKK